MNKEDFKKIISEAVEEKLKQILPKILSEHLDKQRETNLQPSLSKLAESTTSLSNVKPQAHVTESTHQSGNKVKINLKNKALSEVLNSTVVKLKADPVSGQSFPVSNPDVARLMESSIQKSPAASSNVAGDNKSSIVDSNTDALSFVSKALNRNYKEVIAKSKKINENKLR